MRWTVVPLVVLMVWTIGDVHGQGFRVDTIKEQQPWFQKELYTFPVIRMTGHEEVARRIHHDLCLDFLNVDIDTLRGSLFAGLWGDSSVAPARWPNLYTLSWSCRSSVPSLLTVELSGEWCGAYCEEFTTHYTYDLRSGERLTFDSLFTPAGGAVVNDTLNARWRRIVNEQLRILKDSLTAGDLTLEEQDWYLDAVQLYRSCLEERPEEHPYVGDIEPMEEGMRCWIARCSAHVNRNVDDLSSVPIDLPYGWLSPYLRPGIRSLLTP